MLGAPGGLGSAGGVPSLRSGLQGASDALANSLQKTSNSLFATFNAASESFSIEPPSKSAPRNGAFAAALVFGLATIHLFTEEFRPVPFGTAPHSPGAHPLRR